MGKVLKIDIIAGTRPNFVKIAALINAIKKKNSSRLKYRLIHTGQHYSGSLSTSFFQQLKIPQPHVNLEVGSGSQSFQTAEIMKKYEKLIIHDSPDLCIVVGDVNSSMAAAITAKKMNIKLAHIEAGIRSGDRTMPEEINRLVIDSISDYFFTTTLKAKNLLINQGADNKNVFFVGNIMIDTLMTFEKDIIKPEIFETLNLHEEEFLLLTLHRPNNVDDKDKLLKIITTITSNSKKLPILFPVHPRTKKTLEALSLTTPNLYLIEPLPYLEFIYILKFAKGVLTDSGGITEEATVLNIPCITLRNSTERPETITMGTNVLVGTKSESIIQAMENLLTNKWKKPKIPKFWDGKTGERIVDELLLI